MKISTSFAVLSILSIGAPLAIAQSIPPMAMEERHIPRLSSIMSGMQSQHMKLWFAGKAQNWDLAEYELRQIKATLAEAAGLYSGIPVSNVTTLAAPIEAIAGSIEAKDGKQFVKAVSDLTNGCNACHQSMGHGYIMMELPTEQPFSNQTFATHRKK
jgi:hypothetical protein